MTMEVLFSPEFDLWAGDALIRRRLQEGLAARERLTGRAQASGLLWDLFEVWDRGRRNGGKDAIWHVTALEWAATLIAPDADPAEVLSRLDPRPGTDQDLWLRFGGEIVLIHRFGVEDASAVIGCTPQRVLQLVKAGRLPGERRAGKGRPWHLYPIYVYNYARKRNAR